MKIMVVGSGGREHAIIKKIKENPQVTELYALPGNGGIAKDATCVDIAAKDVEGVVAFAKEKGIDFAVVAPDDPLVLGMVDALNAIGIPCFGPDKKVTQLCVLHDQGNLFQLCICCSNYRKIQHHSKQKA